MSTRSNASTQGKVLGLPVFAVVLIAVGLLVGVGIALATALGGDDEGGGFTSDAIAFGPVSIDGAALPEYDRTVEPDPAVGMTAPTVDGFDLAAGATSLAPTGQPTMVAFLAHWCPHCQVELPVLVDAEARGIFEGIRTVGVLTGTNEDAPNFPPGDWIEREGWTGDVIVDNDRNKAAEAFGVKGYPFLVWLDGDGVVVARTSGELPLDALQLYADLVTDA